MPKPQSVVVTARKHNKSHHVVTPNHKGAKTMKQKTTEIKQNVVEIKSDTEVVVNTRVNWQLSIKKLAVTTSLGLAALAASLP